MSHKWPVFDYVRILAATSVIFSHSFLIAEGVESNEPFVRLLGPGNIIGMYGVLVFFVISGFLVTLSAAKSPSVLRYAWHRVLRIYPALFVCLLLTGLIIGAMFTQVPVLLFFRRLHAVFYAVYGIVNLIPWQVATVTFYADPAGIGEGMNGSLWTIRFELFCYAVVALLLALRLLRWPAVLIVFVGMQLLRVSGWGADLPKLIGGILACPSFFAGALIATLFAGRRLPAWPMLPCTAILLVAIATRQVLMAFPLFGAYPLLWIATLDTKRLPSMRRFGDISYGMYLYGWPLEQMMRGFLGAGTPWWQIFLPSLAMAALCGYASWHLIEKHALRLKDAPVPDFGLWRRAPAESDS
jgi:peptidoglycan/LPS O-acetylase OafA/YrhL